MGPLPGQAEAFPRGVDPPHEEIHFRVRRSVDSFRCTFCGELGHVPVLCPDSQPYIEKGDIIVKKHPTGPGGWKTPGEWLALPDGKPLQMINDSHKEWLDRYLQVPSTTAGVGVITYEWETDDDFDFSPTYSYHSDQIKNSLVVEGEENSEESEDDWDPEDDRDVFPNLNQPIWRKGKKEEDDSSLEPTSESEEEEESGAEEESEEEEDAEEEPEAEDQSEEEDWKEAEEGHRELEESEGTEESRSEGSAEDVGYANAVVTPVEEETVSLQFGDNEYEVPSHLVRFFSSAFHAGMEAGVAREEASSVQEEAATNLKTMDSAYVNEVDRAGKEARPKPYDRTTDRSTTPKPANKKAFEDHFPDRRDTPSRSTTPRAESSKEGALRTKKAKARAETPEVEMMEEGRPTKKRINTTDYKEEVSVEGVLRRMDEAMIQLSIRELSAISPLASEHLNHKTKVYRKEVRDKGKERATNSVMYPEESDEDFSSYNIQTREEGTVLYACGLDRLTAEIQGKPVTVMIDTGSEINVMSEELHGKLGLALNPHANLTMVTANNTKERMTGVCENVPIMVGGLRTLAHVHVTRSPGNFSILLGQPWLDHVKGTYFWRGGKKMFRWHVGEERRTAQVSQDDDPRRRDHLPDGRKKVRYISQFLTTELPGDSEIWNDMDDVHSFVLESESMRMDRSSREQVLLPDQRRDAGDHMGGDSNLPEVNLFEDENEPPEYAFESIPDGRNPYVNLNYACTALNEQGELTLVRYSQSTLSVWMGATHIGTRIEDVNSNLNLIDSQTYQDLLLLSGVEREGNDELFDTRLLRPVRIECRVNGLRTPRYLFFHTSDDVPNPVVVGHYFWYQCAHWGIRPSILEFIRIDPVEGLRTEERYEWRPIVGITRDHQRRLLRDRAHALGEGSDLGRDSDADTEEILSRPPTPSGSGAMEGTTHLYEESWGGAPEVLPPPRTGNLRVNLYAVRITADIGRIEIGTDPREELETRDESERGIEEGEEGIVEEEGAEIEEDPQESFAEVTGEEEDLSLYFTDTFSLQDVPAGLIEDMGREAREARAYEWMEEERVRISVLWQEVIDLLESRLPYRGIEDPRRRRDEEHLRLLRYYASSGGDQRPSEDWLREVASDIPDECLQWVTLLQPGPDPLWIDEAGDPEEEGECEVGSVVMENGERHRCQSENALSTREDGWRKEAYWVSRAEELREIREALSNPEPVGRREREELALFREWFQLWFRNHTESELGDETWVVRCKTIDSKELDEIRIVKLPKQSEVEPPGGEGRGEAKMNGWGERIAVWCLSTFWGTKEEIRIYEQRSEGRA